MARSYEYGSTGECDLMSAFSLPPSCVPPPSLCCLLSGFRVFLGCSRGPWRCCLTIFTHDMLIGETLSSPTGEGDALFGAP